jgi:hypothetical protein
MDEAAGFDDICLTGSPSRQYVHIAPLNLPVEVPVEQRTANARLSLERNLPRFLDLPDVAFGRIRPAAIVAGGSSLARELELVACFETVVACGSVHDHLVGEGIIPKYCVIFDPGAGHAGFYKNPQRGVIYLVSSTCDPAVFEALAGHCIHVWHPADDVDEEVYGGEHRIGGGSSVLLRAIPLAHVMGFREMHLFGADCCLFDDREHAYAHGKRGDRITVSFLGRHFATTPQLLQQAQEFLRMYYDHQHQMMVRVYGGGLIDAMLAVAGVRNYEP